MRRSLAEYETARANARRFLYSPGHESAGERVERIVQTTTRFVLVEKEGEAGTVADALDPRAGLGSQEPG